MWDWFTPETFAEQSRLLANAPGPTITLIIGAAVLGYVACRSIYHGRIAHLEERLRLRDDQLALNTRDAAKSPAPMPPRPRAEPPTPAPTIISMGSHVDMGMSGPAVSGGDVIAPQPASARVFLSEAVAEKLFALINTAPSELRLKAFLKPHDGEWVRIKGYFFTCTNIRGSDTAVSVGLSNEVPAAFVQVSFDPRWDPQLAHFSWGDEITLDAHISVDEGRSPFRRCELR